LFHVKIRQHLTQLGVLEMESTTVDSNESIQGSDTGLLKAVISFCQDDFSTLLHTQHATQFTPRGSVLSHLEVCFSISQELQAMSVNVFFFVLLTPKVSYTEYFRTTKYQQVSLKSHYTSWFHATF
jgi:hypothetical protein